MKDNALIFIADDDNDDVNLLTEYLKEQSSGVTCMPFHNGLVLINYLLVNETERPDLIILDINMPVKNGFLTLHELKQHPELSSIPVVMLSSSARQEDIKRCMDMGCLLYFTKPDSLWGYRELVTKMLEAQ